MKERGQKLSGALRNDPKNKPMERLSPGVYRSAGGGLVGQGGQTIQRQPQQEMPQLAANNPTPISDLMYRYPEGQSLPLQAPQMPQTPQPSANMGGQYRLSPGVYGTRDQAMQQYNQQMQQMYQPMVMPYRKG